MSKRILMVGGVILAVFLIGVFFLLMASNSIVKGRIEKALGEQGTIERVSLGWNRVELTGLILLKEGKPLASAKRIEVRASIFSVFRKQFSLSRVTIDRPSFALQIDSRGNVVSPFGAGEKETAGKTAIPRVELGSLEITDGTLLIQDGRPGGVGHIDVTGIGVTLSDISFPLSGGKSSVSFKAVAKGDVFSGGIRCSGSIDAANRSGQMTCAATNLAASSDATGPRARVEQVSFVASSSGGATGAEQKVLLSDLTLRRPYIRLEEDPAGHFISPFAFGGKGEAPSKKEKSGVIIDLRKIVVSGGEVVYLNGQISHPPYPLRITEIAASADTLSVPFGGEPTVWQVSCTIPGKTSTGVFKGTGKTVLRNLDTTARITLRNLDIVPLKPYYGAKGEVEATAGTLDIDMDMGIKNRLINAPTHAVIRHLELAPEKGASGVFLGVPRNMVVKLLEDTKGELPLDFVVEGNLDNPKFSLREGFVRRFAVSLGRTLGISVIETGETVIRQGGRILKGIGSGIRGMLK